MMNDKYLNYISLQQITKYCPWTISGESVRRHFFQGKVSADTFSWKCPRTLCRLSGFLDGARKPGVKDMTRNFEKHCDSWPGSLNKFQVVNQAI